MNPIARPIAFFGSNIGLFLSLDVGMTQVASRPELLLQSIPWIILGILAALVLCGVFFIIKRRAMRQQRLHVDVIAQTNNSNSVDVSNVFRIFSDDPSRPNDKSN